MNSRFFCVCVCVCVQWEQVEYFDNKIICDLVEEKHQGILAVLVRHKSCLPHTMYALLYTAELLLCACVFVCVCVCVCVG